MEKCDFNLAADISVDCSSMSVKGLGNRGWIFNFDDVDREASTFDKTNPSVLTSFILGTGSKGYKVYVPGSTPFTGTNKSMVKGNYVNTWTKQVKLVILNEGPDVTTNVVDKLANGRFIVVLENKATGSDGKATYEVYGWEAGLTAAEITNDKYSEETNGGYSATLEETGANKSGVFLYGESLAATKTMLESLEAGA